MNPFRKRRERRLRELDRWRVARKLANADVTDLGEQLAELHLDTLGDDLGSEAAHHYRQALVHYEQAKDKVDSSTTIEDVPGSEQLMADARYHRRSGWSGSAIATSRSTRPVGWSPSARPTGIRPSSPAASTTCRAWAKPISTTRCGGWTTSAGDRIAP